MAHDVRGMKEAEQQHTQTNEKEGRQNKMTTYENIKTLTAEELNKITFEGTTYDAALVAHINKCEKIAKALLNEVKKYEDIAKAHESELAENKLVTIKHGQQRRFSKDKLIEEYGKDVYEALKVLIDTVSVSFG